MLNAVVLIIFYFLILIYSIIIHEVAHGVMALWLGDNTAKYAGRISLNPFKHIDPWMTIMVPFLMLIMTNFKFAFGGAKPVPYNPYNLKNQKWGPALVAAAGPISNIILALFAVLLCRILPVLQAARSDVFKSFATAIFTQGNFIDRWDLLARAISGDISNVFFVLLLMVIFWNVLLAVFNLIPIPPLDGSKILFTIVPIKMETMAIMEQYGFIFLLILILFFPGPFSLILSFFWQLFFTLAIQ